MIQVEIKISGEGHSIFFKMSAIEYNNLLFEISRRLDELNVLDRLRFMFRGKLAAGSEGILDALSLFQELEQQNILGADRLEEMKELLNGVEEWSLLEKVEKFESKRKEYHDLLEQIIGALDELNELERLIAICRGKIPEDSGQIHDARSLFKELESQNNLGIYRLDVLKVILTEMKKDDLFKEVERFEERRKQEVDIKRRKGSCYCLKSSMLSMDEYANCRHKLFQLTIIVFFILYAHNFHQQSYRQRIPEAE